MSEAKQIDPRGPRFGAGITAGFAICGILFFDSDWRFSWSILWILFALFTWSVFLRGVTHPYAFIFQKFVRPRLAPPKELEDSRPPYFAQQVGLSFASIGVISGFVFPAGLLIASSFIFIAAFLNAFFDYCLGCQVYLGLRRLGLLRK